VPSTITLDFGGRDAVREIWRRTKPGEFRSLRGDRVRPAVDSNLIVGGELLQVLKGLAITGRVDLVIQDPPWAGPPDFVYNPEWERDPNHRLPGVEVRVDPEESWLRFLVPRVDALRDVLTPAGVFITTVDHRGLFMLGQVVDEVFGVANRLTVIGWEKQYGFRGRVGSTWDYLIVVARDREAWMADLGAERPIDPPQSLSGSDLDGSLLEGTPTYSTGGTRELDAIVGPGHRCFAAKPSALYAELIRYWSRPDALVCDPFAGSGALGHAVLSTNASDEAHRRFVMIDQAPPWGPSTARDLTAERIRRVIEGERFDQDAAPVAGEFVYIEQV
jgi:hypothetical protein